MPGIVAENKKFRQTGINSGKSEIRFNVPRAFFREHWAERASPADQRRYSLPNARSLSFAAEEKICSRENR